VSCILQNDENGAVCTPPCILIEYNGFNLSEFLSFLCFYDFVSVRQEFNIRGHFTARYSDCFARSNVTYISD